MTKIDPSGNIKENYIAGSSVLQRYHIDEHTKQRAIRVLKIMEHNGELHYPEPWVDDKGNIIIPWGDGDGALLDCWMDMLGLNGRPMNDTTHAANQNSALRHHLP